MVGAYDNNIYNKRKQYSGLNWGGKRQLKCDKRPDQVNKVDSKTEEVEEKQKIKPQSTLWNYFIKNTAWKDQIRF